MVPKITAAMPVAVREQLQILPMLQSDVAKGREVGLSRKEVFWSYIIGDCICCKRKNITIVKKKEMLCNTCLNLCKNYITKHYSYYHSRFIHEAIIEVRKPFDCKFCTTKLYNFDPITGEPTKNRKKICEVCWVIYKAGWVAGNREKMRSQFLRRPGLVKEPKLYGNTGESWLDK